MLAVTNNIYNTYYGIALGYPLTLHTRFLQIRAKPNQSNKKVTSIMKANIDATRLVKSLLYRYKSTYAGKIILLISSTISTVFRVQNLSKGINITKD